MREHKAGDSPVDYPRGEGLSRAARERIANTVRGDVTPYRRIEQLVMVVGDLTSQQRQEVDRLGGLRHGNRHSLLFEPEGVAGVEALIGYLREQGVVHAVTETRMWDPDLSTRHEAV